MFLFLILLLIIPNLIYAQTTNTSILNEGVNGRIAVTFLNDRGKEIAPRVVKFKILDPSGNVIQSEKICRLHYVGGQTTPPSADVYTPLSNPTPAVENCSSDYFGPGTLYYPKSSMHLLLQPIGTSVPGVNKVVISYEYPGFCVGYDTPSYKQPTHWATVQTSPGTTCSGGSGQEQFIVIDIPSKCVITPSGYDNGTLADCP